MVRLDLAEDKAWRFLRREREYITDADCMEKFMVTAADRQLEDSESQA